MSQQKNAVNFWTLDVTVLRAENIINADYWSEADCYVTVCLQSKTQSQRIRRTNIVPNSKNPEWEETFNFILDDLESPLEVCLYDEDPLKCDNLIRSIKFDISSLTAGEKETKEYPVDPEGKLWLAFQLQESKNRAQRVLRHLINNPSGRESVSYWTLNVTILSGIVKTCSDYMSKSDCYVILSLPTATARTCRTKTASNTCNPVWNETFSFRVPSSVKNVLEINLYDEDPLMYDDLIATLMFDISNLSKGKETKAFDITPENEDKLLVEFELLNGDHTCEYLSNGVLMAAPFSALDIDIDKLMDNSSLQNKVLKLRGAYQEDHTIEQKEKPKLRFYINRDLETELGLAHELDFEVETHECKEEYLAVRLDFDIPMEEKAFLKERKVVEAQSWQKLFGFDTQPEPEKLPTIAVVASGGGARAMTGMLGSLRGLKEIGVLDATTYITGLSGSTWTLATLYQDPNWSQNIDAIISAAKEQMSKSVLSAFSLEKMKYYNTEMDEKGSQGYPVSFIDMGGLILEHLVFGEKINSTLSEQQGAVNEGQNPLPIYNAVNIKDGLTGCDIEAEWCEFTPYEVGLPKYGAFVQTEDFGSHFFLGHLVKKLPEVRIPYLLGIFSSVFSVNLTQIWSLATGCKPLWTPWLGPAVNDIEVDTDETTLDTTTLIPMTDTSSILTNFLKDRPVIAEMYNIMRGLFLSWDYSKRSNFVAWKDRHPDTFPNQLTPNDPTLRLVDAGHAINLGCVPILRPERDVDIIITLSYSWDPECVCKVLKKTAAYCKDHNIPFPNVDFASLEKEPKEVYIIEDKENPKAPIVVHFPLVNITFKDFKSPGVKRETEEEMNAGKVDVSSVHSPYTTKNMTFSKEDFEALVNLTSYNVSNNKEKVLKALRLALEKKSSRTQK